MNRNWIRWITASVYSKFGTYYDANLPLYFDGAPEVTIYGDKVTDRPFFADIKIQGMKFVNYQIGHYRCTFSVSAVFTVRKADNVYILQSKMGHLVPAFEELIAYKLGDGDDDDQSILGCIQDDSELRVDTFGWDKELKVAQGLLEKDYRLDLTS